MKNIKLVHLAWITALVSFLITFSPSYICQAGDKPRTSYKYIVVYGTGDLEVGDVVEFFDPEGTLCGKWVVRDEGAYGLMPIYGDDPTTDDVDEGARLDEVLTIKVNGREVYASGSPPVYEQEGETRRIDL